MGFPWWPCMQFKSWEALLSYGFTIHHLPSSLTVPLPAYHVIVVFLDHNDITVVPVKNVMSFDHPLRTNMHDGHENMKIQGKKKKKVKPVHKSKTVCMKYKVAYAEAKRLLHEMENQLKEDKFVYMEKEDEDTFLERMDEEKDGFFQEQEQKKERALHEKKGNEKKKTAKKNVKTKKTTTNVKTTKKVKKEDEENENGISSSTNMQIIENGNTGLKRKMDGVGESRVAWLIPLYEMALHSQTNSVSVHRLLELMAEIQNNQCPSEVEAELKNLQTHGDPEKEETVGKLILFHVHLHIKKN